MRTTPRYWRFSNRRWKVLSWHGSRRNARLSARVLFAGRGRRFICPRLRFPLAQILAQCGREARRLFLLLGHACLSRAGFALTIPPPSSLRRAPAAASQAWRELLP